MVGIVANYTGKLGCEAIHEPSGTVLATDAPVDNGGRGGSFSPTDLVATALLTCIMTTMAIFAEKRGLSLDGMNGRADKVMAANPRRIGEIKMVIEMPVAEDHAIAEGLKAAAMGCPVHHTLSHDTTMTIDWRWAN